MNVKHNKGGPIEQEAIRIFGKYGEFLNEEEISKINLMIAEEHKLSEEKELSNSEDYLHSKDEMSQEEQIAQKRLAIMGMIGDIICYFPELCWGFLRLIYLFLRFLYSFLHR